MFTSGIFMCFCSFLFAVEMNRCRRYNSEGVSSDSSSSVVFGPQLPPNEFPNEVYDRDFVDAAAVPESFPSYFEAMEFATQHDFVDREAITRFITAVFTEDDIEVFSRFGRMLEELFGNP